MHRVESILSAIQTTLTGLTTTGANVVRDRVYPPENLPMISIDQGEDVKEDLPAQIFDVESNLTVNVNILVKADSYTTQLNQIRAEVYAAMMASSRLGLSYVDSLLWVSDSAPEIDGESETKTAVCTMQFQVGYVHSLLSKEA